MNAYRLSKSAVRVFLGLAVLGTWACNGEVDNGDEANGDEANGDANGSGVDGNKYTDELTDEEARQICTWVESKQGGAGEHTCSDTTSVTVYTVDECTASLADASVHCLVSQAEDCVASAAGDPCQMMNTAACQLYIQCAMGETEPPLS